MENLFREGFIQFGHKLFKEHYWEEATSEQKVILLTINKIASTVRIKKKLTAYAVSLLILIWSVVTISTAAVCAAGMACAAVFLFVVVAFYCRVIVQFIIEQSIYCIIGLAGNAAIKLDACL